MRRAKGYLTLLGVISLLVVFVMLSDGASQPAPQTQTQPNTF